MIGFLQQYGLQIGAVVVVLIIGLKVIESGGLISSKPKVRAKTFLTKAEREALQHIETALPWCRIHAQVAMGAIVQPAKNLSASNYHRERGRFSQKIIDFVAEDRSSGKIVVLIELDDRTHKIERDAMRDRITKAAGYQTSRLKLKWPNQRNVGQAISKAFYEIDQFTANQGTHL